MVCFFNYTSKTLEDKILSSLGNPTSKVIYTNGDFLDYTDYGIYYFENIDLLTNEYFKSITVEDKKELFSYFDNFESWIKAIKINELKADIVVNYRFDRSIIDENDYFYIDDKCNYEKSYKGHKFGNYNVYFFDVEQQILYFFHNNI